ncbi:MAG TPA: serine/threonine-protein kinase [Pseudomonadales bacterium]|nr:serine/threonine-protein kinase [Pseudomonadales bacterium]
MFELQGYTITRKIGEGGMALVYLATQNAFKRQVAIKVLSPAYASDYEFAQRFLRESETVASLSHASIIPVYDFGQKDGTFYMVMEYLPGGDLTKWIQRGLEEQEILQITSDIASALHLAHEKGFVHRDVKPDNVMFRENNTAVLTDFGIARQKNANNQVTVAGAILGTPKYMSPEQLQGHPVDARSDIYSLGIMFYEMLTKKPPYEDPEFMALAMKHLQAPIPKLPAASIRYQGLFEKMVAKQPDKRFQSGLEIVKILQQARSGQLDLAGIDSKGAGTVVASSRQASVLAQRQKHQNVREGLQCEETVLSKSLFSSKYKFTAEVVALDWTRLSTSLSTLGSTQLLDWYSKRGRQCEQVEVVVLSHAENYSKARAAIKRWADIPVGKLLKKTGIKLVFQNIEDGKEQTGRISL